MRGLRDVVAVDDRVGPGPRGVRGILGNERREAAVRVDAELRWSRLLIAALLLTDLIVFPIAEGGPMSAWDDWLRVAVTLLCMWRPLWGVPLASALAAATTFMPMSEYDKWLFVVPPAAAAFAGRRWLPVVAMIGPVISYAFRVGAGDWFSVPLWSPVALGVGIVANAAFRQAVRDEANLSGVILERERLRLQERGRLADELDRLILIHLDTVGTELERESDRDDVTALRRAVARVDASAQDTLQLLRQAVGYLRDGQQAPPSGVDPTVGLRERLEQAEDGLVGHGHGVEFDLVDLPLLSPVLVESVARVVDAAAARARALAPAGSTCRLSTASSGDKVVVTFERETSKEETAGDDPTMEAAAARVRLIGGTVVTGQAGGWATTVVTVPREVRTDVEESPAAARLSLRSRLATWSPRWLGPAMAVPWLVPLLLTVWDIVMRGQPFTAQDAVDVACYVIAVIIIAFPGSQRIVMLLLAALFVLYAVADWQVSAVMWLWLTAGGVAVAQRRWFPQWVAMGFTFLLWNALTMHVSWVLVGYAQLSLLFIAGGLTVRYFQEHRARLLGELERERRALSDVRLKERRLLAGELHDVVAHQLSLMTLQAASLADVDDIGRLRLGLRSLADLNHGARSDLTVLRRVMVEGDDDETSSARVGQAGVAAETALASAGFEPVVGVLPEVEEAARPVRLTVVRLLRECSTNMLRYAPPRSRCTLRAWVHDSTVYFEALNPVGGGWRPDSPLATGAGLAGLAERIGALGGTFSAGEQAGRWVVSASMPLEPPA